jgi:protein-S-isoprenylcysteine O-methyltransferase Ste14
MNSNTSIQSSEKSDIAGGIVKRLVQIAIFFLIQAVILFASAGRLDWTMAWVYLAVYVAMIIINFLILLHIDPTLIAERARIKEDAKSWDKPLAGIISLFGPLLILLVAGFDLRFGWSPELVLLIQLIAWVAMILGYAFSSWAMASNRFFSGLVRIQTERGHTVATGGPYQYVRHPGYSGWSLAYLATPLVLGSWWALIPAVLTVGVIIVRTALEDKMLQQNLGGYQAYVQQVRYRLLPGVW